MFGIFYVLHNYKLFLCFYRKVRKTMIYECSICRKIVYLEDEFVDHIKEVHLSEVDDEIELLSEMISFYSDLKKTRRQEALLQKEIESADEWEFFGFYGNHGERLIFTKD